MAKASAIKEQLMREAVEKGTAVIPAPMPQRAPPPMDLAGAATTDELQIDLVCNALIDGYSLRDIAAEMDRNHIRRHGKPRDHFGHPSRMHATTVLRWIESDLERASMYESSRAAQADTYFSELFQLANEPVPLTIFGTFDSGAVQDKRLRIDTLKFIASKLAPRRYGEKLDLTSGGEKMQELSPAQAEARLVALLAKAQKLLPAPDATSDE
jgi:hypothetical protein